MRALRIVQEKMDETLAFMHKKRKFALWRAVEALLTGQRLWLTALGRALPGVCSEKHRIKAIDRLLGNASIQSSVLMLYAALAKLLLNAIQRPILLVDWTGADPGFAVLSAQLVFRGRSVPIFSRVFPKNRKCSPKAEREFLDGLFLVIPAGCRPILVTDAGFLTKWFCAVKDLGWDFVGRFRNQQVVHVGEHPMTLVELHQLARSRRPRDFGKVMIGRHKSHEWRVVLSPKPKVKGRKRIGRNGAPRRSTADRQRRDAARQPWVLVTSLSDPASFVVEAYRMRMQVEETFRDLKSHRYGWSAEDIRSGNPRRIDVLFLIAAFASVVMHVIGVAATAQKLERGLQANTIRNRPVFSTFFLAKLIIAGNHLRKLSPRQLGAALSLLFSSLTAASHGGAPQR